MYSKKNLENHLKKSSVAEKSFFCPATRTTKNERRRARREKEPNTHFGKRAKFSKSKS